MTLDAPLKDIAAEMAAASDRGRVASYIPELACVDPGAFGIAVVLADGTEHGAGDAAVPFSIQSISKVFMLAAALERIGDALWARVGREPSGNAFNSIVQLERERGVPRNPFINAGAIVMADVLLGDQSPSATVEQVRAQVAALAGESIAVNASVAASEQATGARNRSLAHFMAAEGNLEASVEDVLATYFGCCAIEMSCRQLAQAGQFLACDGLVSGERRSPAARVRQIGALMLTCGHYDGSGDFAYRVGLPGKSGVGGGILAIAPGQASIAVWSPGLGEKGNSRLGALALERLTAATGWSVFAP
ncbi:MAG: glutaminase [Pseudomonadota bacterium]